MSGAVDKSEVSEMIVEAGEELEMVFEHVDLPDTAANKLHETVVTHLMEHYEGLVNPFVCAAGINFKTGYLLQLIQERHHEAGLLDVAPEEALPALDNLLPWYD